MGKVVWLLALAALFQLGSAGSMHSAIPGILHRAQRAAMFSTKSDDFFDSVFVAPTYLLKPTEMHVDDDQDSEEASTEVANKEWSNEYGEESSEEQERFDMAAGAKFVFKTIGKVGLKLLKKGINFLKSTFFKFGGKRLLKRAKDYITKKMFSIEPLSCKEAKCESCLVFKLPFKVKDVKEFRACASMELVRERGQTNFTVGMNIHTYKLFDTSFPMGDIANCYKFDKDPDGTNLASMIGTVCVQGFELEMTKEKTGKFCLALAFKRYATGYRFCAERRKKKDKNDENKDDKKDPKDEKKDGKANGNQQGKKGNSLQKKKREKDPQASKAFTKKGQFKWKFELKRISCGEQDNQIISDESLFKNEAKLRKKAAERILKAADQ